MDTVQRPIQGGIGQTATASYQFLLFTLAENVYTKFGIDPIGKGAF